MKEKNIAAAQRVVRVLFNGIRSIERALNALWGIQ